MKIVIDIDEEVYNDIKKYRTIFDEDRDDVAKQILNGTPIPKCHGDLIDRKELEVVPIDITDLPKDRCLMVYLAEDVEGAEPIIEADKGE